MNDQLREMISDGDWLGIATAIAFMGSPGPRQPQPQASGLALFQIEQMVAKADGIPEQAFSDELLSLDECLKRLSVTGELAEVPR